MPRFRVHATAIVAATLAGVVLLSLVARPSAARQARPDVPAPASGAPGWTEWGGPRRDFIVEATGLADSWPDTGPPVVWSRPLGTGHSAIVVDEGLLFTMYRVGNGRARQGPWEAEEVVAALEAATGRTVWEHRYPSRREDFSFGAGPHATPLVVGDRLFTIGTNQQLFAFDKRSGRALWSHDFIAEFRSPELLIRPNVKTGYGCSPIAFRDTIICSVGGPGQSVVAFRQEDGAVVWKSGDFLTAAAAPILVDLDGETQLVFLAGGTITGLDPATGRVLWSHPHDPGNDLNCSTPIWGPDNVLVVSSAYKAGSRAVRLQRAGAVTEVEELWFTNRVRFMFLGAIRLGDVVYGTTGDFGPAFLTALDIKTGESLWQHRGFGRASLLHADGKTIIMDEDGDLALSRLTPEGATILAQAKVFDTVTWTAPTLVGTTLFARDREKIVALDLARAGDVPSPGQARRAEAAAPAIGGAALSATPAPNGPTASDRFGVQDPTAVLSGTWTLDPPGGAQAGPTLAGVSAAGAPPQLFVTHAANGTVVVESAVNGSQARYYRPGRETTTATLQGGAISMTSTWAGRALVAEGVIRLTAGATTPVKERFEISDDGQVLTVEVGAESSQRWKYMRLRDMGPCETWPTPCKRQ